MSGERNGRGPHLIDRFGRDIPQRRALPKAILFTRAHSFGNIRTCAQTSHSHSLAGRLVCVEHGSDSFQRFLILFKSVLGVSRS